MKRKSYSVELETRVVKETIRDMVTINETVSEYDVRPSLLGKWKKQAMDWLYRLIRPSGFWCDRTSRGSRLCANVIFWDCPVPALTIGPKEKLS